MKEIAQHDLCNNSSAVLRAAEAGEVFVVIVDGRPVATLGPYRDRQWVAAATLKTVLRSPTDETVLEDLDRLDRFDSEDPWGAEAPSG